MGRRGAKRGGGRGRGGFNQRGGGQNYQRRDRENKQDILRQNEKYERYYNELNLVAEEDRAAFWEVFRRDLPNSFRFTGSKAHALAVQQRLRDFYIPEITSITYEGQFVDVPQAVPWYPDQLAWYMTTPKNVIRRFPPFASFQKFLVAESDVGNISRQEVVSMIPPLVMDLKPGMTVLDLCAAPGSKSAQLIEMIHAGEEERSREVARAVEDGSERPSGEDYDDDGRSTGLLISNDVDYKRAHMLVHQMKRLSSPNIIVTNHDATVFPSIKLPSPTSADGRPVPNRYLKFDRILADVPCSGDGTTRKNIEIWRKWTPSNGLGLHVTQARILVRALQMLKVGGRVVYSTCSMNPVEDEAVLAHAVDRCGGTGIVDIVDTSGYLPGLKRHPGMRNWKVMDKAGRIWESWLDVEDHRERNGDEGTIRLQASMFPPSANLPLERCMRLYPYQQDTGAFFVAILEKKTEIRARPEDKARSATAPGNSETTIPNGTDVAAKEEPTDENGDTTMHNGSPDERAMSPLKRKRDNEDATDSELKRIKAEDAEETYAPGSPVAATEHEDGLPFGHHVTSGIESAVETLTPVKVEQEIQTETESLPNPPATVLVPVEQADNADAPYKTKKKLGQPFEEPFKYMEPNAEELNQVWKFYKISLRFPRDRFMVRNASGSATKNIYYTTALARDILQENEGKGMKFVHSGVKMFVKQDVPSTEVCPWRIQTDGLTLLETWVGPERVVKLTQRNTLRKLLIEMFPRFHGDDWKNLGEIGPQVKEIGMGCCVLRVEPSEDVDGLRERMTFPLWKSLHSLNLMLPKEDRKALLLRLFNDDTPLINQSHNQAKKHNGKVELKVKTSSLARDRTSSSPGAGANEPDMNKDSTAALYS